MEFKEFSGELIPAFEDKAISKILELEGGYNPKDAVTGQPVKYGIDQRANPDVNVKDLTEADARRLYSERYFRKSGADKLPEDLALVHFDAAVNQGNMAQKFLEQSGGDLDKYIELRRAHYINLAEQDPAKYGSSLKGWLNRLDKVEQEAKGMRQEFVPFEGELDTGKKGFVEKAKEYVGEQADLLAASGKIGVVNAKLGVKQNQIAGLMELQEADFAKYGKNLEGMPEDEKSKHMATRKKLEEYLGDVAKYSTEIKNIEKEYGVRGTTKALMRDLPQTEEYKKASTLDKFKMIGEKFIEDPVGIVTDLGIQSLPQSLAVVAPALVARFGKLSPTVSAGAGGASSAMMNFGSEYANLREQGMPHEEAWEKAGVKSGVVGIFDAASFMTAGSAAEKIISGLGKGTVKEAVKTTAKEVGKETGRQAALGAAGEAVGSAVIGQEIEPTEVFAEAAGEIFGAPGEAVATYRGKRAEAKVPPQFEEVKPEDVVPPTAAEPTPEEKFAEAPTVEVRGVGQVPTSEALDYEAMLAELEGRDVPKPVAEKQLSEEVETVEPTPVEAKSEPVKPVETPAIPQDELLTKIENEEIRNELKYLAENAGWAEVGGRLLRENAEDQTSPVVGRTQWIPKQEWWTGRPATKAGAGELNERQTQRAVEKALNGEKLNAKERRLIEYMVNVAEGNISTYEEYAQQEREALEDQRRQFGLEAPTPEQLRAQEEERAAREAEAARIEAEDAAERERQEIRRLGERGAEDFALGRTAAEDLMGQRSVFEAAPEEDIDAEMARKAEEGRAEIERRRLAGEEDYDIPFNIERKQTQTPEFKKWFGDSKVVDENKNPLVMYHGTSEDIDTFKPNSRGLIFVTSSKDTAELFSSKKDKVGGQNILPVYVRSTNPFDYENESHVIDLVNNMPTGAWGQPLLRSEYIRRGSWEDLESPAIIRTIKDLGYDGMYVKEGKDKNLALFNPNQLKSAIGNRGTFALDKDDITLNLERLTDQQLIMLEDEKRAPSLRVELNRLVKDNREGRIPPETFAMRVEQIVDSTKKEREFKPRERGENIIREKLIRAKRRGELSDQAVDLAEWFIKKNPNLVEDVAISIRAPKDGEVASGMYNPLSRMVYLIKGSGNTETAVHEILHHTERMMPEDIQKAIRKAWAQSLAKADKEAQKKNAEAPSLADKDLKDYFQSLIDFHFNGNQNAIKKAKQLLYNGDVGYEYYQYLNPSEFWAVNASDIVAKRYAATNSVVGKIKRWLAELAETIKSIFGLDNKAPLIKALNSLAKSDGKFVSTNMLAKAVDYANIHRNYKGDAAPLATWDSPTDSKISDFLYKIQDRFVDVKDVQKAINEKVGEIEEQWDPYLKEELYHGRTARKMKDFLKDDLNPILAEMAKNKVNLQDFDNYLHNRHAEERNVQIAKINPDMPDGGSGIFTEDARAYLDSLSPEKKKIYDSLAKKSYNIIRKMQNVLVESGLEEQNTIDTWNKTYDYYVPLMREDLDFSGRTSSGMGMGYGVRGSTSRRAMGSFKDVADIFANIAAQYERAIVRAEKARIGRALYGLAIKNPNPDFWLPVNPDAIKSEDALKKELLRMGLDEADAQSIIQEPKTSYIDPNTGLVAYRVNPILRSSDNVFPVRINGKDRYIFFNPSDERAMRMVRALKNLDADQLGTILGMAAKITRWIASVNTQYNPVFGAYNFLRDVGGAQFNLSTTPIAGKQIEVSKNVFPALKAIYRDLRRERAGKNPVDTEMSKLWQEFQREGGITGYRDQFSKTKQEKDIIQKELDKLTEGKAKQAAIAPVRAIFNWLSDYNDTMENAVRLSAYKVALEQGLSKERAASLAKNLTVNFNRKGEKALQAGALYAFFNASVQGTKRLQETLTGPAGKKIIAGGLLLGVLQGLMLAAAGFDEDEPPDFVKERNIIIPLGEGKYAAFPMPLGLHVIPSTGRMLTEFVISGGKNPAKKTVDLLSMYLAAFNPIGNSGLSMQTLAPTALDPIAAIFENRDNFGRPIAKEDRATNPTPGYTRSRDNATAFSKFLSEFLNYASGGTKYQKGAVSPTPDQIDYLIGQATGGVGREVQKVEQLLFGEEEVPSYKIPLVGKFYGDAASQTAQKNRFYQNIVKMANHEQEIKGRIKNKEGVTDYYEENPDARLWRMANRVENEISQINKRKKEMKERGASPEAIKRLEELKLRKMQQFNERVAGYEE